MPRVRVRTVGSAQQHHAWSSTRARWGRSSTPSPSSRARATLLGDGSRIDLAFQVEINERQGNRRLQISTCRTCGRERQLPPSPLQQPQHASYMIALIDQAAATKVSASAWCARRRAWRQPARIAHDQQAQAPSMATVAGPGSLDAQDAPNRRRRNR